ncbi:hypothetical protein H4R19_000843 [Coemansia spiralis]|nr:hypothetical protein H4R19_000843 [Coemansia spiralis]
MVGAGWRALLLASVLWVLAAAGPRGGRWFARAAQVTSKDLAQSKGGILVKGGNQTSCELGVLDSRAAFVSADCLVFSGSYVDTRIQYQVLLDAGSNKSAARFNVTKISVHPSYIPATKANNIALVQFNAKGNITSTNRSAIGRNAWKELVYVRRVLRSLKANTWDEPVIRVQANGSTPACATMQPLYKANDNDFTCDSALVPAPSDSLSQCKVPYAMVYARVNGTLYQAGLLSHAAVMGGKDLCTGNQTRTYFTAFASYLTFAEITLNRTVRFAAPTKGAAPQDDPYYAMRQPAAGLPAGVAVAGGDYYRYTPDKPPAAPPKPPAAPPKAPGKELSKRNIIIIACCVGVGVPALVIAGFFFVRWYRGHKKRTRDPYRENARRHMLVHDLGGAYLPPTTSDKKPPLFYTSDSRSSSHTGLPDYLNRPIGPRIAGAGDRSSHTHM